MRYLLWAAGLVSVMSVFSIFAEAGQVESQVQVQDGEPARVAPKVVGRVPASNLDPIPTAADEAARAVALPAEFEGASIEVGFTQDDEPEPHLFAIGSEGRVQLFQLEEASNLAAEHRIAKGPITPPTGGNPKVLPIATFLKRIRQATVDDKFFVGRQPRPKSHCKDRYVLRIKVGQQFRERRGCTNQSSDVFAGFSQLIFRDAFIVWTRNQYDAHAAAQ